MFFLMGNSVNICALFLSFFKAFASPVAFKNTINQETRLQRKPVLNTEKVSLETAIKPFKNAKFTKMLIRKRNKEP